MAKFEISGPVIHGEIRDFRPSHSWRTLRFQAQPFMARFEILGPVIHGEILDPTPDTNRVKLQTLPDCFPQNKGVNKTINVNVNRTD